jgi:ferrochelatase
MARNGRDFRRPGVLLLNFGGPTSIGEVKKFLFNLFSDENIVPLRPRLFQVLLAKFIAYWRKRKTARRLEIIGGKSPLVEISSKIAGMLEKNLRQTIPSVRVYAAMRYTPPFIEETLLEAKRDRVDKFIVLPLYPQFCRATTGSSFSAFRRAHKEIFPNVPAVFVNSYHDHPLYVSAVAQKVKAVLSKIGGAEGRTEVIFTAHSIPLKLVSSGDPYLAQVKETAAAVAQALGLKEYTLAFQSAPRKRGWLSPTLEEAVKKASRAECSRVLFVPISFTCDNLETLYDVDVAVREKTEKAGMIFSRAECLNSSPAFIHSLARTVLCALFGEDI